ncbi:MAG TPA: MBL fold metallo-hydrolase [Thermoanaerobaculia bacterium]|jgi:glyoxylase-like metal-dependent hydrolase (beta-lactamase superfamily II)|nr:MBL fold metallo-hydrolase [Thermoanaerobaculia bacterium]
MRVFRSAAAWSALACVLLLASGLHAQESDAYWERYGKARAAKAKGDAKGYAAALRSALEVAPKGSVNRAGTLYELARAEAMAGTAADTAAALADLTRLFEEMEEPGIVFFSQTDPVFAATRALPGYRTLLGRIDEIQVTAKPVHGAVWVITGAGCTQAASVGPDGVLLVDSGYAPLVPKVRAALAKAAPGGKIRYVINTHVHEDHTGGNAGFSAEATVISSPKARLALAAPHELFDQTLPIRPAAGLPSVTVETPVSIHINGEDVHLVPLPGHTDGDLVVIFPKSGVVHMGDDYFPNDSFPYLVPGDDPVGFLRNLTVLEKELPDKGFAISGHAAPVPLDDLKKRVRVTLKALGLVNTWIAAGVPSDEVVRRAAAAGLPAPDGIKLFDEKIRAARDAAKETPKETH